MRVQSQYRYQRVKPSWRPRTGPHDVTECSAGMKRADLQPNDPPQPALLEGERDWAASLETSMAQQHHPDQHPETFGAGRLVEKGWTVYDAVEHPIGTVTDVDAARGVITVDGRPVGFDSFEVPLDLIGRSGGNEVHLTKVIESDSLSESTPVRLIDPPAEVSEPTPTRTRARTRPVSVAGAATATGSPAPVRPITPTFGGPVGEPVAASDA